MTARDHTHYREDIGAYLLGALTDLERQAFETTSPTARSAATRSNS